MFSRLIKCLTVVAVISVVTGCKLAVIVPSGGDVTSASGTKNCSGGSLCEHNITAADFNETFTAVARPGYVFTKWSSGPGFNCPNSTNPTCTISNVGTAGNVAIEAVIATGTFFYAMPLFDFVGIDTDGDGIKDHVDTDDDNDGIFDVDDACPLEGPNYDGFGCPGENITDTVTANGKEWAQVDLFIYLTWSEINAVCPEGVCAGMLKGYNITGWTWASVEDVTSLFNSYGINPPLAPYQGVSLVGSTWAPAFYGAGWRPTDVYQIVTPNPYKPVVSDTNGWSRTLNPNLGEGYRSYMSDYDKLFSCCDSYDSAGTNDTEPVAFKDNRTGAWFYRTIP